MYVYDSACVSVCRTELALSPRGEEDVAGLDVAVDLEALVEVPQAAQGAAAHHSDLLFA
jgi:hypothetical protein